VELGVFIPIGNNGWLISETAPQYMPTFELNKTIVLKAEQYGLDFALSMIKLRGLSIYQLLEHSKVVGWAEGFGAGWRCAADRG